MALTAPATHGKWELSQIDFCAQSQYNRHIYLWVYVHSLHYTKNPHVIMDWFGLEAGPKMI